MLTMGLLIVLYLCLAIFAAAARKMGADTFEQRDHVAERKRVIARGGFKSRAGIR
jgi:hypothetical protein